MSGHRKNTLPYYMHYIATKSTRLHVIQAARQAQRAIEAAVAVRRFGHLAAAGHNDLALLGQARQEALLKERDLRGDKNYRGLRGN